MINLVTFRPLTGGVATFTKHLIRALGGYDNVCVLRVGRVRRRNIDYSGIRVIGVTPGDVRDAPTIVLLNPLDDQQVPAISLMLRIPCILVHHCRTSVYGNNVCDMTEFAKQVVVIRKILTEVAKNSVYLRHPYFRSYPSPVKTRWAISHSQVIFKKGHDVMLEANRILPDERKIEIWGTWNNMHRMYVHHVLSKKFPEYQAKPFDDPMPLCGSANYDVDLTDFPSDGGGTQYTFLEAADGKAVPILRKSWLKVTGDIVENVHCLAVSDAQSLSQVLQEPPPKIIVENNEELLRRHDGEEWLRLVNQYR